MSQHIHRRFVSGSVWFVTTKVIHLVSAFLANALLARLLPTSEVGHFFLLASVVATGSLVAKAGTEQGMVKLIAGNQAESRGRELGAIVRDTVLVVTIGCVIVALILLTFGRTILTGTILKAPSILNQFWWYLPIWIVFVSFQDVAASAFRGLGRIGTYGLFAASQASHNGPVASLLTAVCFSFLMFGDGSEMVLHDTVICVLIATALTTAICGTMLFRAMPRRQDEKSNTKHIRQLISVSLPLCASAILATLTSFVGLWIVGATLGSEESGYFAAAQRLALFTVMPLGIIAAVCPPLIAESAVLGETKAMESVLRDATGAATFAALLMVAAFGFFGEEIMRFAYGPAYATQSLLLFLLCLGYFANVAVGPCGHVLAMTGHQHTLMAISFVGFIITCALSVVMGRAYHTPGVAAASALGLLVQSLLLLYFAYRNVRILTVGTPLGIVRILRQLHFRER